MRWRNAMGNMLKDARLALRTLWKSPGLAWVGVATLVLGIGANTSVFSVVHGILLRPLPFDRPDELVWLREVNRQGRSMPIAWPNYTDWRASAGSFTGISVYNTFQTTILGGAEPFVGIGAAVGEDFWEVFPVEPTMGRLTGPQDHLTTSEPVVVVSRSLWETELAGRSLDDAVIVMGGTEFQVVGVLPDDFSFPAGARLWGPAERANSSLSRTAHNWSAVGRLGPGVSLERASEELNALTRRIVQDAADEDPNYLAAGVTLTRLRDVLVGNVRLPLLVLLGAAVLVLLIACVNLAGTLLARGLDRETEVAIRSSLGASRGRLVAQFMTETLVLGTLGGMGGVVLAYGLTAVIRTTGAGTLPRVSEVTLNGPVLAYTAAATFATIVLFGLVPALRLAPSGEGQVLRGAGRTGAREPNRVAWRLIVGGEVALALILVAGSALLVRSFRALTSEDSGFDPSDVAVLSVSLSPLKYQDGPAAVQFYQGLFDRVWSVPGVASVGVMSSVPIQGFLPNGRVELDGDMSKTGQAGYVVASEGAFAALDVPLLRGRLFDERDGPDDEHVAVVSESFTNRYWPGEDPVGKQVTGGGMDSFYGQQRFAQVVGVVGDVRHRGLGREVVPTVYFPYSQRPGRVQYGGSVVVESASAEPEALTGALRKIQTEADSDIPFRMVFMTSILKNSLGQRRFVMGVLGGFSLTALLLAAIGIFGVVSASVTRRKREMGIRLALGAEPSRVRRMVVSGNMRTVTGGLVVGVIGGALSTKVMSGMLYKVSPLDPESFIGAVLLLSGVALLSSWVPAIRGTRVNPVVTMKAE